MAFLACYGHVSPSDYSVEIRDRGMTWSQAIALQSELVKLRKQEIDFQITLAKLSAGVPT